MYKNHDFEAFLGFCHEFTPRDVVGATRGQQIAQETRWCGGGTCTIPSSHTPPNLQVECESNQRTGRCDIQRMDKHTKRDSTGSNSTRGRTIPNFGVGRLVLGACAHAQDHGADIQGCRRYHCPDSPKGFNRIKQSVSGSMESSLSRGYRSQKHRPPFSLSAN